MASNTDVVKKYTITYLYYVSVSVSAYVSVEHHVTGSVSTTRPKVGNSSIAHNLQEEEECLRCIYRATFAMN